jgi:hypothetical protein
MNYQQPELVRSDQISDDWVGLGTYDLYTLTMLPTLTFFLTLTTLFLDTALLRLTAALDG